VSVQAALVHHLAPVHIVHTHHLRTEGMMNTHQLAPVLVHVYTRATCVQRE
jgi:hypothetical protein